MNYLVKASIIIFARPTLLSPALGPNGFAALRRSDLLSDIRQGDQ
jgi:hypothetical protein